jgi:CubicO group peptidase (beta-lactamase class C family)
LGFVVEEYTNQKLEHLSEEYIFTPLGMKNTSMVWKAEFDSDYALGYDKSGKVSGMAKRPVAKAAGSMTTTASDYAKFVLAIMKRKDLNQKLLNEMLTPQVKIISKKGFGPARDSLITKFDAISLSWGLGVGLFKSTQGKAFFHTGHDNGWQNYFVAYPDKKMAVILMSNSSNFEPIASKILSLCITDKDSPLSWLGYYDNND